MVHMSHKTLNGLVGPFLVEFPWHDSLGPKLFELVLWLFLPL